MAERDPFPSGTLGEASWRVRIAELQLACAVAHPSQQAEHLRQAFQLLALAPLASKPMLSPLPAKAVLEALLDTTAHESAALALLGGGAGYMLSRGAGGQHLASVVLAGQDQECTAGGETAAMALIAAMLAALIGDCARRGRLN